MNWTKNRTGNLTTECKKDGIPIRLEIDAHGGFKGISLKFDAKNYHDGFYNYPIIFSGKQDSREEAIKYVENWLNIKPKKKEIKQTDTSEDKEVQNKITDVIEIKGQIIYTIEAKGADKIKYTTDGKEVNKFSKVYKEPIKVNSGDIINIKRYYKDGRVEDDKIIWLC